jgi:serine/threonine protein kinase
VLHRDLKPDNILVTSKGVTKLLDFGLAKVVNKADSDSTSSLEGKLIGTPAYMSPEQALGKLVDERSDMFSFGAVLYEMLSGNRAFRGNSSAEVLSAVLHDDPIPVSAPLDVERIVMRCLRRAPTERYENISEVRSVLTQVSMDLAAKHPSIAVLPFDNMSASKDDEYFGDGLAEEILNLLTHIPGLKVTARTSSFAFRGQSKTTPRSAKRSAFARSSLAP